MNKERFRFFRTVHHESDLMVGVAHTGYHQDMEQFVLGELIRLRELIRAYARKDPRFISSLEPRELVLHENAPEIETMINCGQKTGTGPMAAVAGMFAQTVGKALVASFGAMEVVVENGGDLYLWNEMDLISVIHAGSSPLSRKMGFVIPPGQWGIATSSGTVGHSFSRGLADAVTVVGPSAPLADSWATAIANRVRNVDDLNRELEAVDKVPEILACAIVVDKQIGIRGELQVKLLSSA